jgi:hypothetical protein
MASIGQRPRLSKARRRQRRRRQARKTRAVRRQLHHLHDQLPGPARAPFGALAGASRRATALRFGLPLAAALLTVGRHTVTNLPRTPGPLVPGDPSRYRRVFSRRRWPSWRLAKLLAGWAVGHLPPARPSIS